MSTFTLHSLDIAPDSTISLKHVFPDIGGQNISPALEWKNAPVGTKSFAITCYDPDAPTGSGWWHWVIFNIPASTTSFATGVSGKLPAGIIESRTDYGATGWGGPYPPVGDKPHRYIFTVFALSVEKFELDANTSAAMVGFNLHFNTLAKASFTGLFGR